MMRKMRTLAAVIILTLAGSKATAQEPPPTEPPPAAPAPTTTPAPPPPTTTPPTTTTAPTLTAPPTTPPPPTTSTGWSVSPLMAARWHRGRVLYGVGSVIGLVGSALTLSSVLAVAITGYPCNPDDPIHQINPNDTCNKMGAMYTPPKPTDTAPLLAYMGSSASALGFVLAASGLGYQHHLLYEVGADPGRGVFAGGTTLGLLGFASVGLSYFFGFTNYLAPHDQGIAILASSMTGTVLCLVGGILYTSDASRLKRAWERISTF